MELPCLSMFTIHTHLLQIINLNIANTWVIRSKHILSIVLKTKIYDNKLKFQFKPYLKFFLFIFIWNKNLIKVQNRTTHFVNFLQLLFNKILGKEMTTKTSVHVSTCMHCALTLFSFLTYPSLVAPTFALEYSMVTKITNFPW